MKRQIKLIKQEYDANMLQKRMSYATNSSFYDPTTKLEENQKALMTKFTKVMTTPRCVNESLMTPRCGNDCIMTPSVLSGSYNMMES